MNKNATNYQNPLQKSQRVKTLKFLIFKVGKLNLALSIERVKKVLHYTPVYSSGLNFLGVAHIGEQEITVIDLHRRLFHESQAILSGTKGYLILAQNTEGEFFGIWVGETPTLVDAPINQIRELPESYRRADTLEIASHVTVIKDKQDSLTVFILDADRLLSPVSV
ncbi:chemotaxis protein CheW [Gloeothece verrucosa]|uniref:CheW protein n=1 Tax=Gloeothece verrucosa (strain PCC 7822) TaxID=497965 RepID=E0UFM1_GLOV7|nr:chemotaxis protein CheW [Gloeothece verrucosa]ADN13132.1 CheW protein [Gloeothece verrucosa PCC 7822]